MHKYTGFRHPAHSVEYVLDPQLSTFCIRCLCTDWASLGPTLMQASQPLHMIYGPVHSPLKSFLQDLDCSRAFKVGGIEHSICYIEFGNLTMNPIQPRDRLLLKSSISEGERLPVGPPSRDLADADQILRKVTLASIHEQLACPMLILCEHLP